MNLPPPLPTHRQNRRPIRVLGEIRLVLDAEAYEGAAAVSGLHQGVAVQAHVFLG